MTIATANVTTNIESVYTSVGNTAVTYLSLCNYSVGNVTANIYIVPNGGTAGSLNQAVSTLAITSTDSFQFYAGPEKLLLENGDSIQVEASGNSAIAAITSYTSI